ncbi:vinculin-like isoform X2 [Artemia franciscana]
MPVFHTKTIESILDPVAQQVSRLVILHEEAEDGNAMPDLERPVQAVSKAVINLVKVGKDTCYSSDDALLKQDMPPALYRVESAAKLLEEAAALIKEDAYSVPARKKLIEGSRGILQGTSSLLLCFDEAEVRKIVQQCKKVIDYLSVAEVIEGMEDLVQFVKDLSPCLTKVSREVDCRQKELTHQVHREILLRCLEQVKTLAPILICSMKIFIQIASHAGKGIEEASENRNYLAGRMSDEIQEIIRVLQLTTYDEEEWDADDLTVVKKAAGVIDSKLQAALDWLEDSNALRGGVGEKSLRNILEMSNRVAERALPEDAEMISKHVSEISSLTDALGELRADGKGTTPQAEGLARSLKGKLVELSKLVNSSVQRAERSGVSQPAHTVQGRLEQARKWLTNPTMDNAGLGQQAIGLIVAEGKRVAEGLAGENRTEIISLCNQVDSLSRQLGDLCRSGQGHQPQAQAVARLLSQKLDELKQKIQGALVGRVVEDLVDILTPLKQFTEAVTAPEGTPNREKTFNEKAQALVDLSSQAAQTARLVAAGGSNGNKKLAESLIGVAAQVESLTPQLVSAGRIRMTYPEQKAADEHFENLRRQYAECLHRLRGLCDEATDVAAFMKQSEEAIKAQSNMCEDSINGKQALKLVEGTSTMARLANRVLMVAKQETENSEDPQYIQKLRGAMSNLQAAVTPLVQDAKCVALDIKDQKAISKWRESSQALIESVGQVRRGVTMDDTINGFDQYGQDATAPPRPPLPGGEIPPPRPPPPETDDEDETFRQAPKSNQPIMVAAHGLHEEVKQWSSKDNDLVKAAKRMASLMARLSQLVRGEGGNKRDLIACAKEIAEASEEVTRLAKDLARQCTDKRMRTNLLQVCERIPTIGTQLKILSTVKATMLGAQGTEEDQEATDMLVGNAQNLMQSVKETVRAAEAASIKIRTESGIRLRWIRRQPWYQY